MDLYEPLSSGEEEELVPVLPKFPPIISQVSYTPLDNTRNEIRLLQILSAETDPTHIRCQMATYSLDNKPTYSALSYVWGDQNRDRRLVFVNNSWALVTRNLADALSRLREDCVQRVWVDAICIDQSNDDEKGHQVQKMGIIYQRASTVLAWIGSEDDKSARGIQVMRRVAALTESLQLQSVLDPCSEGITLEQRGKIVRSICQVIGCDPSLKDGDIGLVLDLMDRPYWGRLWVIQEISLASSAIILCGASKIPWDEVQRAMVLFSWLRALSELHPSDYNAVAAGLLRVHQPYRIGHWTPPPAVWVSARIRSKGKYGMQLFHLMDETCNNRILKASDPRDHIYALLGLAHEDDQKDMVVDYASPVPTVFARATLLLLRRHGARVLMYSGLAQQSQDDGPLPSWAIDWSHKRARATGLLDNPMRDIPLVEPVRIIGDERLALRAALRKKIFACVPFLVCSGEATKFIERIQASVQSQQLPSKNLDLTSLKRTVWRVLLHRRHPSSLSVQHIDGLFEDYLRKGSVARFIQSIMPASPNNMCQNLEEMTPTPTVSSANDQRPYRFQDLLECNECPRTLFVTEDGSIGSGPIMTSEGDIVCAFPECDVPFLLRREDKGRHEGTWKLIGPVYVDDMVSTEGDGYFTLENFWATKPEVEEVVLG